MIEVYLIQGSINLQRGPKKCPEIEVLNFRESTFRGSTVHPAF